MNSGAGNSQGLPGCLALKEHQLLSWVSTSQRGNLAFSYGPVEILYLHVSKREGRAGQLADEEGPGSWAGQRICPWTQCSARGTTVSSDRDGPEERKNVRTSNSQQSTVTRGPMQMSPWGREYPELAVCHYKSRVS